MLTRADHSLQYLIEDDRDFQKQWQEFERSQRSIIEAERAHWGDDQLEFDDWLNTPEGIDWLMNEANAWDDQHGIGLWIGEAW